MIYTIKKDNHRSVLFPRLTFKKSIFFSFRFLTDFPQTEYTNKIYGLIDGIDPHKNSVRLGFRRKRDKIEISSIVYNNGVRTITTLKRIELDELSFATIAKLKDKYIIKLNEDNFSFKRTSNFNLFSFRLFPFWGGVEKSAKEFKIEIVEYECRLQMYSQKYNTNY